MARSTKKMLAAPVLDAMLASIYASFGLSIFVFVDFWHACGNSILTNFRRKEVAL